MCTLVMLCRPGHEWPVLMAANRDEMLDRTWSAPARHWPDRPEVVAGRDELAGGSWLGINDYGVVAGILNRMGSLGPSDGKRALATWYAPDSYAFGVMLWELLTLRPPWPPPKPLGSRCVRASRSGLPPWCRPAASRAVAGRTGAAGAP